MPEIVNKKTQQKQVAGQTADTLPLGFNGCGALFDHQTIERIGIRYIKQIAEKVSLDSEAQTTLNKIADHDVEACRDFLMSLDHNQYRHFLNSTHRIAALCEHESAENLINSGASPNYDHVAEVVIHAYFLSNALFELLLQDRGQTQPFPEKSYQVFQKRTTKPLLKNFDSKKVDAFKIAVGTLYQSKSCTSFTRVTPVKNGHSIGIMLEHGTKKSGFSTLSDSHEVFEPQNPALRLRNTDFIFVDTVNQMLWCNSPLLKGKTKADILSALGELFYDDSKAFTSSQEVNLVSFNSQKIASLLRGFNISSIKAVELRHFTFVPEGFHNRNKTTVPGPYRKGCLTEIPEWTSGLPKQWKTLSAEIVYETYDGNRETITLSGKTIRTSCSPNFNIGLALLKHLKVISGYDN